MTGRRAVSPVLHHVCGQHDDGRMTDCGQNHGGCASAVGSPMITGVDKPPGFYGICRLAARSFGQGWLMDRDLSTQSRKGRRSDAKRFRSVGRVASTRPGPSQIATCHQLCGFALGVFGNPRKQRRGQESFGEEWECGAPAAEFPMSGELDCKDFPRRVAEFSFPRSEEADGAGFVDSDGT